MKKSVLAAALFVAFIVAAPAHAQLTGASVLHAISENFQHLDGYAVVTGPNSVKLNESATGRTVFEVREDNAQTITLSSVVMNARSLSGDRRERMLKSIAMFNFSSPVGTLWMEDATGDVTLVHHLNPRFVSPSNIVSVAMMFGDMVRTEKRALAL